MLVSAFGRTPRIALRIAVALGLLPSRYAPVGTSETERVVSNPGAASLGDCRHGLRCVPGWPTTQNQLFRGPGSRNLARRFAVPLDPAPAEWDAKGLHPPEGDAIASGEAEAVLNPRSTEGGAW